jgi:hypothetical protein
MYQMSKIENALTLSYLSVCSVGVDGDVFGRVTKLGLATCEAVARAVAGEPWDAFHASKCIDTLLTAAGGIPSLIVVEAELAALRDSPLLARLGTEDALQRIRESTFGPGCTELDLILRSTVERAVLRGEFGMRVILEHFCAELLDRAALTSRGGFIEQYGHAQLDEARTVLAPVALAAAAGLERRPDAKRLSLARAHANLTPSSNLLGG